MDALKTAYQDALKEAIDSFFEVTTENISFASINDHMSPAEATEDPFIRPIGIHFGKIRILHPSHSGTYKFTFRGEEYEVEIDAGRLMRSLDYEAGGPVPDEMVLRKEIGDQHSTLEFGTSVEYNWHEERFQFLEKAFDDVAPEMPTRLGWSIASEFENVSVHEEVKLTIKI